MPDVISRDAEDEGGRIWILRIKKTVCEGDRTRSAAAPRPRFPFQRSSVTRYDASSLMVKKKYGK